MRESKLRVQWLGLLIVFVMFGSILFGALNRADIRAFASGEEPSVSYQNEDAQQDKEPESNPVSVYAVLENESVSMHTEFCATFQTEGIQEIVRVGYEQKGFTIVTEPVADSENDIHCTLLYEGQSEKPYLTVHIFDRAGNEYQSTLYGVRIDTGVYLSGISYESAKDCYLYSFVTSGQWTEEEYNAALSQEYIGLGEEKVTITSRPFGARSYGAIYVEGTLQWKDDSNKLHPLQFVKVDIVDYSGSYGGSTYTDVNGNYTGYVVAANRKDVGIKVYPEGENCKVLTGSEGDGEYSYTSGKKNVDPMSTVRFDWTIDMKSELGQAFQISQALITATRYVKEMNGAYLSSVTLKYPHQEYEDGKLISGCFYRGGEKCIFICVPDSKSLKSYASWDVIMHEYGHHVQHEVGITASPGGSHRFTDDLSTTLEENSDGIKEVRGKSKGIRLAWGESYPSVFGAMAQQYYKNDLSDINTVGDEIYDSYNGAYCNYETCTTESIKYGEACETTVIGILWDIYDDVGESHDSLVIDHKDYWKLITKSNATTLSDFVKHFNKTCTRTQIDKLGDILSYYQLAPYDLQWERTGTSAKFSWKTNANITNTYPFNQFKLHVFNSSNQEIKTVANLTSMVYTFSDSEWSSLTNQYKQFYVRVEAIQPANPLTGNYYSRALSVNTENNTLTIMNEGKVYATYSRKTGTVITLPTIKKTGYDGYYISKNTGSKYQFGSSYIIQKDDVLTAYWASNKIDKTKVVRSAEVTIKDIGDMSNHFDSISISELTGYSAAALKSKGYTKITFTVSLNVKEVDDGYQYICFYNGTASDAYEYYYFKFEHGSGKKDTSYWIHTFEFTLNVSELSETMCIRYNASGAFSDTWCNKDLTFKTVVEQ